MNMAERGMPVTSDGEEITREELIRRKSDIGYCGFCGAVIKNPNPLRDRCAVCSETFAKNYYETPKAPGQSGLWGGE